MKVAQIPRRILIPLWSTVCVLLLLALALPGGPAQPAAVYAAGNGTAVSQSDGDSEPLVFTPSLTGVSNIVAMRGPASGMAGYLTDSSGVAVAAFVPTDYGATIQGLERGVYDIVYLPAPLYVKANAQLGATGGYAVSMNGSPTETGLIIVGADSDIEALGDLAERSVGAANVESGAGWIMPAAALRQAGVNPMSGIDLYFTGTDPENVLAVVNGELDAAFVTEAALSDPSVLEAAPEVADQIRVLAEFADVPVGVIAFRADLDETQQAALMDALADGEALAAATDADGAPVLEGLGWDGLVALDEVDFSALTDAALVMGVIKEAPAAATPAPTEEPAEEATPAPTEEPGEEATAAPTEEPVEEATAAPTEEPAEEATPAPTEEPVEEATAAPTEEPAEEAAEREPLVITPLLSGVSNFVATRGPTTALAAYLTEATGVPVAAYVPTDYGATLQGLRRGAYDVVYLPSPLFAKAHVELDAQPGFLVSANGVTTATGLIVVAADSGLSELGDLATKTVGAADVESGAGWVMPAAALKDAGVNPLTDIDLYFTGTDAENLLAVVNGEMDAAFITAAALEDPAVLEAAPDVADQIAILAEFTDVPVGVLAFRAGLDEADQAALVEALSAADFAAITDVEGTSVADAFGWDGVVPAQPEDFATIIEAATTLGMIRAAQ